MKTFKIKNLHFTRIEEGKEIITELKKECEKIKGGVIIGIGGINKAKIAVFDPKKGGYNTREVKGFHEVASLTGNISRKKDGELVLHLHIVVASKKEIVAGHLIEAYVQPTLEVAILEFNKELKRTIEAKGLTLIDA